MPLILPLDKAIIGAKRRPVTASPIKINTNEPITYGTLAIWGICRAIISIVPTEIIPTGIPKTIIAIALPKRTTIIEVREIMVNSMVPFLISAPSDADIPYITLCQIAISGAEDDIDQAIILAKSAGASRVVRLQVSGAFHTPLMQPAVDGMAEVMATLKFNNPTVPIIGNTTAQPLTTAGAVKEELLTQLCNCVQWQRSIEYMVGDGVSNFIEIGPGRVLAGLIKRIDRDVKIINIGDAEAVNNVAQGVR